ncbi:MAG: ArnT family glycosyltransferase, partial [Longimicrobiales bacterium]
LLLGFQPWIPFKILIVVCSTAAIVLSYYWMRRKLRPELAVGVALLMALSPGVLGLSHWELSDVPFWAFTSAALLAWERLSPTNTRRLAVAIVLTMLAYFTRSAGLPLLVAAGLWLSWKRRWRQLAIFALGAAPLLLLWWWRARTQGGVDYVQQFWWVNPYAPELGNIDAVGLVKRALANSKDYLTTHLPVLLMGRAGKAGTVLASLVIGLAVFGWIRRLRHAQVSELFLPLYLGLLLVWPAVWSGERFLVPALPLILFYAAEALQRVVRKAVPTRARAVSLASAAAILLLALPALVENIRWGRACSRLYSQGDRYACLDSGSKDLLGISELAGLALPDSAVILSRKPRLVWAASGGRPGRNYPMSPEPDSLFKTARETGAQYVILDRVDRLSQVYLMPAIMRRPDAFCILYSLGPARSAILAIRPTAITTSPLAPLPDSARVQFQICGPEYWRSPEVMESVLRGRAR